MRPGLVLQRWQLERSADMEIIHLALIQDLRKGKMPLSLQCDIHIIQMYSNNTLCWPTASPLNKG